MLSGRCISISFCSLRRAIRKLGCLASGVSLLFICSKFVFVDDCLPFGGKFVQVVELDSGGHCMSLLLIGFHCVFVNNYAPFGRKFEELVEWDVGAHGDLPRAFALNVAYGERESLVAEVGGSEYATLGRKVKPTSSQCRCTALDKLLKSVVSRWIAVGDDDQRAG